ncbi:MAG: ABC transporter permease, partial [Promethearchaeota archaeon]
MDTKVGREIKTQKKRSLLIVSIIAITLALITGLRAGHPMMLASLEENLIVHNVADGRFTFAAPIMENNVTSLNTDPSFLDTNEIALLEGRLIFQSELDYNGETFPAIIIGTNFPNQVNQIQVETSENATLGDNFLNSTNCIIEKRFAGSLLGQDIGLDENVSITLGTNTQEFTIKGYGSDVDFLYVVDPKSQMTLMGQMAVVWMDLDTLQQALFNGLPMINQILFTVDNRLDTNMTYRAADALTEQFYAMNIDVSSIEFTLYDETIDREFFNADAGSVDRVGTIFGILGLIVCSVAIYNTLSRVIQSQRRNIGLFMSMGANRSVIIGHYLKITMVLASVGIIVGLPLGYAFSIGLTRMVVSVMGMTVLVFPIAYNEYILASLVTLTIAMLSSIFSAWPITTVTPREAMSAFFNRIKTTSKNVAEKFFGWIPGFRAIYMLVPIREIFMRKKKSLVSILAITTSMIILINSVAMVANMYSSMTDNYTKYNTADVIVKLETPVPISQINSFMANLSSEGENDDIVSFESFISIHTKLSVNDEFKSWMALECYQENSTLRNFNIIEGDSDTRTSITKNAIILGNTIAGKYDIGVDD